MRSLSQSVVRIALVVLVERSAYAQAAVGDEGQACYPNETCNAGLTCASHICVKLPSSNANAPVQQETRQVPTDPPKEITNWHTSEPIVAGYHPETRPRWDFVAVGAASWGFVYLLFNMLPAASSMDVCKNQGPNCDNAAFLFIPIIGPFAQMSTRSAQNSALAMVFLGVDAAAQLAATTVAVVGFAWPRHYLKRDDVGRAPTPTVLPYFTGNTAGIVGTF